MTLKQALLESGWESFQIDFEPFNTQDELNNYHDNKDWWNRKAHYQKNRGYIVILNEDNFETNEYLIEYKKELHAPT